MKKFFLTTGFIILASICFSQEFERIAKNQMDETIVVFTYKLKGYISPNIEDINPAPTNTPDYSTHFLIYNGVTKSTFDYATGLFTIYANENTVIPNNIILNKTE